MRDSIVTNHKKVDSLGFQKRVKYRSLRAFTLVVITCLFVAIQSFAQVNHHNIEFLGTLQSYVFSQHYDFNPGFGAEAQIRFWPKENLGFALTSGISFFTIDQLIATSDSKVETEITKEGTLLFFPVGGSILLSQNSNQNPEFIFEGGVRYVFVESDLEEVFTTYDSGIVTTEKTRYDIGNGVVGLVSAYVVTKLSSDISLSIGLGYQFDIDKGKEVIGDFAGKNELRSFLIRAGLITDF